MQKNYKTGEKSYMPIMFFLLATFFWGINFHWAKYTIQSFSPFLASAIRFIVAGILVILHILFFQKLNIHLLRERFFTFIFLGLTGGFLFNICFFYGMKYTSPLNAAFIFAFSPLIISLLSFLSRQAKFSYGLLSGLVISLTGVLFILSKGNIQVLLTVSFNKGDILLFLSSLCFSIYSVVGNSIKKEGSSLINIFVTMCISAILFTILALNEMTVEVFKSATVISWVSVLSMGVFASYVAYILWVEGIKRSGPTIASLFYNMVSFFTLIITMVIGEPVILQQLIGGGLIIAGVIINKVIK
ncbi:MAG: DMT family transporter [Cytophagaceae bacterium]